MQVDGALANARPTSQFIDRHPAITPGQQQLSSGIEDAIRPFSPVTAGAFHHHGRQCMTRIRFWSTVTCCGLESERTLRVQELLHYLDEYSPAVAVEVNAIDVEVPTVQS